MEKEVGSSGVKPPFSTVCSPPLSLLYKNTKKKGKPSFTQLDVDDDELYDALCKISKSSEELWKEISPPSPIGSKASQHADWMSLDAAVHASANNTPVNIPRIEVEGPPDQEPHGPFDSRYNPANFNNHLSRVPGRGSSSNLTAGILPLKSAPAAPSPSMLPPPSPMPSSLALAAPNETASNSAHNQLPVFSTAFANYASPNFGMSPPTSISSANAADSFSNTSLAPSITTNSISISGNVNINIQNTAASHSITSSPLMPTSQTSPTVSMPAPGSQSPPKKETRRNSVPQFTSPYTPPQLKIHQYMPPTGQPEEMFNNPNVSNENTNKLRLRENERLWGEVVLNCNKLKTHASRGVLQPLSWAEINDAMNSTRLVMSSLVNLLSVNSYAYANIYNSVAGFHSMLPASDDLSSQFMRFQQFDTLNSNGLNMVANASVANMEVKKEGNEAFSMPYSATQPLAPFGGYEDGQQRKIPRREGSAMVSSSELSHSDSNPGVPAIQNVMSMPGLSLSPVITALSNMTPVSTTTLSGSADTISNNNGGSSSDDGGSGPSRSYSASNSPAVEPSPKSGGNWGSTKKSRGKKVLKRRSKYAELDLMCLSCGVKQTPEWRRGPAGAKTLCNACGLHWAKVLKAEGKAATTDSKKSYLLEQKRNQFMMLAKRDGQDASPNIKSESH